MIGKNKTKQNKEIKMFIVKCYFTEELIVQLDLKPQSADHKIRTQTIAPAGTILIMYYQCFMNYCHLIVVISV